MATGGAYEKYHGCGTFVVMPTQADNSDRLLQLIFILGKLKTIPRTGWTRYPEIEHPESVAEHTFRCAAMAMLMAPQYRADPGKTAMMLVMHEIGEAVIGDVVTDGGRADLPNRNEKLKAERLAVVSLLTDTGFDEYIALYDEFAANESTEAKLANQIDKLEMGMQAREYELQYGFNPESFYESVRRRTFNELHDLQSRIEKFYPADL